MTTNQISYYKAKVDEAHYLRSDAENQRHNYAVETLTKEVNEEARRANLAREQETHRANVANETNYYSNLQENIRHNLAVENLNAQNLELNRAQTGSQIKLNESNTALNTAKISNVAAETQLTGTKITGQQLSNAEHQLTNSLNSTYSEGERVFKGVSNLEVFGVNVGGLAQTAVNLFQGNYFSKSKSNTPKKEYFALNTR